MGTLNKRFNDHRLEWQMSRLGKKIKHLRKHTGKTQMSLAFEINSSQSVIHDIENNPSYNPTLLTLLKIADVFNVTPSELLRNTI